MARPRKPLEMQTRHNTKTEITRREYEQSLLTSDQSDLDRLQAGLLNDATAKKEYKRILKEVKAIEMIGNLDRGNLVAYCNAWSRYLQAQKSIREEGLVLVSEKTGVAYENPMVRIAQNAYREMSAAGDKLGMSVSARLKSAAAKREREEEVLEEQFGDI